MDRRIHIFALFGTLSLLALGAPAVQAQRAQALAPAAQPAMSEPCALTQEQCTVDCLGRSERGALVACLMGCDNAAALCARDEEPTLSSEWYVEQFGNVLATKAGACHDTTPCPSEYGSCGSWSEPYTDCGDPYCGVYRFCGSCSETWCFGDATRQHQERYRVCFNSAGQSCTEWQRISIVLGCGC